MSVDLLINSYHFLVEHWKTVFLVMVLTLAYGSIIVSTKEGCVIREMRLWPAIRLSALLSFFIFSVTYVCILVIALRELSLYIEAMFS